MSHGRKRERERRRMAAMMGGIYVDSDDDDLMCAWYAGNGGGREGLSDKEIEAAHPLPYPHKLLAELSGLTVVQARTLLPDGYSLRVAGDTSNHMPIRIVGGLERTRINVFVDEDKIYEAFVG